jgi:hypothetical protein
MVPSNLFPRLTAQNHPITSPPSADYNCVAWSAADTEHWWQPGVFWPVEAPSVEFGIVLLEEAFRALGYEACDDAALERGFEKVALYGNNTFYTHAARQLPDGKWTSKLGSEEDIEHDTPEDVADGVYGAIVQFMKRTLIK